MIQFSEADLEEYLCGHLSLVEPGLELLGRQVQLLDGRVDILARDQQAHLVIIELKINPLNEMALGQLARYMGAAIDLLDFLTYRAESLGLITDKKLIAKLKMLWPRCVRGILIGPELARPLPIDGLINISIYLYQMTFGGLKFQLLNPREALLPLIVEPPDQLFISYVRETVDKLTEKGSK